jgi:prepilin-type processing-associated H-X9-DG protein
MYKVYGYYEVCGSMGANNLISGLRGPNNVVFADGHHIRYGVPGFKLGGTVYGERTVDL